ncbi:MAG: histidine kinase [Gammaproteobacteria bacterium]|nr:histidine kinase [Gammaproteobacteria bacterium]MDH5799987.1 histidine kinase [Gammaproteobacteria bacterium]
MSNKNQLNAVPGETAENTNKGDDFFLPDFCDVRMVFAVVVIGELLAIVLSLAPTQRSAQRWEDLGIISLFIQWVALISAAVLCLARPWLAKLTDTKAATASYVLLLTTTTLVSQATYYTIQSLISHPVKGSWYTDFLLSSLGISAIVSAVALRYFYIQHQYIRNLQAKSQARIQALQSRIRPHFLFNSLNTIASLASTQPDLAEEATLDLADLFRGTLADSNEVPIKDEWNLARRYLRIEKLRLGKRLQVEWSVDTIPSNALMPQLTIQPLVENAIYHGIEHVENGGTIVIAGTIEDDLISITITNPVPATTAIQSRTSNKMAQENTRLRLQASYGKRGKLAVKLEGTHYQLTLSFPYKQS